MMSHTHGTLAVMKFDVFNAGTKDLTFLVMQDMKSGYLFFIMNPGMMTSVL